jgi:hypothetical protein
LYYILTIAALTNIFSRKLFYDLRFGLFTVYMFKEEGPKLHEMAQDLNALTKMIHRLMEGNLVDNVKSIVEDKIDFVIMGTSG